LESGYVFISSAVTIVSIVLLAVTLYSYKKSRNPKLIFIVFVFLLFFIRGLLLSIGLFYDPLWSFVTSYYVWVFDLIILTVLYLAALTR